MINNIPFVFFGTPEFSVVVLAELEAAGLLPLLIVTAPDAPKGRGLAVLPSPVRQWAAQRNIQTLTPLSLSELGFVEALTHAKAEVFVIAAYGYIFPDAILAIPPKGTLNIHPSLLPKYRGSTPIQGALLSGEKETGVTVMLTDQKLDHGPILAQATLAIASTDDAISLTSALAHAGGTLAAHVLPEWVRGNITPVEQDEANATYTKLLKKIDGKLNWDMPVNSALLQIRAYQLWPTTWFEIPTTDSVRVRIIAARRADVEGTATPGTLRTNRNIPCIAMQDGWLQLDRIRIAGKGDTDGPTLWTIVSPETQLH